MFRWYLDQIRQKVAEAARAGLYDALAGGTGLTHEQAAQALAGMGVAPGTPPPAADPAASSQLAGPGPSDVPALAEAKRGPGRPRKHTPETPT